MAAAIARAAQEKSCTPRAKTGGRLREKREFAYLGRKHRFVAQGTLRGWGDGAVGRVGRWSDSLQRWAPATSALERFAPPPPARTLPE